MLGCILVALISLASLQPILSQDVDSRAGESSIVSGGGGGQMRNIHSQKHLSPHRMMHFGKRPMLSQAPAADFDDLYLPQAVVDRQVPQLQQQQQLHQLVDPLADGSEYSVFFNLPQAAAAAAELQSDSKEFYRNKQFADLVHNLLLESKEQCKTAEKKSQDQNSKQNQRLFQDAASAANLAFSRAPNRLMKLIQQQNQQDADAEANAVENGSSSSNGNKQQQQQQGEQIFDQQQDQSNKPESINVVSRSLPKSSSFGMLNNNGNNREPFDFNKVHIASLLLGRRIMEPPSSIASLGTYIKKAEPHKMTFMHFG